MIPPARKSRNKTEQTLADEQAKAAADTTAKAVVKAAAKKRNIDQCDPSSTSMIARRTRNSISLHLHGNKENQEENTRIGGVSTFQ